MMLLPEEYNFFLPVSKLEIVPMGASVNRLRQYRLLHYRKWCARCSLPTAAQRHHQKDSGTAVYSLSAREPLVSAWVAEITDTLGQCPPVPERVETIPLFHFSSTKIINNPSYGFYSADGYSAHPACLKWDLTHRYEEVDVSGLQLPTNAGGKGGNNCTAAAEPTETHLKTTAENL